MTVCEAQVQCPPQEVVPDELMELFLSMTDGSKAQSVDIDLPFYCAYSLPGVVLTLGPSHWPLLRPTFDLLASDMQVGVVYCSRGTPVIKRVVLT